MGLVPIPERVERSHVLRVHRFSVTYYANWWMLLVLSMDEPVKDVGLIFSSAERYDSSVSCD